MSIVGHSERRGDCGETDAIVRCQGRGRLARGPAADCLHRRDAGRARSGQDAFAVLETQLKGSVPAGVDGCEARCVAYEPVWAIGTGKTPTVAEVAAAHAHIRKVLGGLMGDGGAVPTALRRFGEGQQCRRAAGRR